VWHNLFANECVGSPGVEGNRNAGVRKFDQIARDTRYGNASADRAGNGAVDVEQ
jgi:hypothetical protein